MTGDAAGIRVCVAGITGWTGKPVAAAIEAAPDLELVAGVSRSDPGQFSSVAEAIIKSRDLNGDKLLSFDEFWAFLNK